MPREKFIVVSSVPSAAHRGPTGRPKHERDPVVAVGDRFGIWTVIELHRAGLVLVRCAECGAELQRYGDSLAERDEQVCMRQGRAGQAIHTDRATATRLSHKR